MEWNLGNLLVVFERDCGVIKKLWIRYLRQLFFRRKVRPEMKAEGPEVVPASKTVESDITSP
jgi:hypothetical protein